MMNTGKLKTLTSRLRDWEKELVTNKHNLAHLAERCINVIKKEIKYLKKQQIIHKKPYKQK